MPCASESYVVTTARSLCLLHLRKSHRLGVKTAFSQAPVQPFNKDHTIQDDLSDFNSGATMKSVLLLTLSVLALVATTHGKYLRARQELRRGRGKAKGKAKRKEAKAIFRREEDSKPGSTPPGSFSGTSSLVNPTSATSPESDSESSEETMTSTAASANPLVVVETLNDEALVTKTTTGPSVESDEDSEEKTDEDTDGESDVTDEDDSESSEETTASTAAVPAPKVRSEELGLESLGVDELEVTTTTEPSVESDEDSIEEDSAEEESASESTEEESASESIEEESGSDSS